MQSINPINARSHRERACRLIVTPHAAFEKRDKARIDRLHGDDREEVHTLNRLIKKILFWGLNLSLSTAEFKVPYKSVIVLRGKHRVADSMQIISTVKVRPGLLTRCIRVWQVEQSAGQQTEASSRSFIHRG